MNKQFYNKNNYNPHCSLKLCKVVFPLGQARLFTTERVLEPGSLSHSILLLNNSRNKFITDKSRDHQLGPWGNVLEKGSHPLKEARLLDSISLINVRAVFLISSGKASFLFVSRDRFSECPNMMLERNPGRLVGSLLRPPLWNPMCNSSFENKNALGFCVMQVLSRFQSRNHFPLPGPLCVPHLAHWERHCSVMPVSPPSCQACTGYQHRSVAVRLLPARGSVPDSKYVWKLETNTLNLILLLLLHLCSCFFHQDS